MNAIAETNDPIDAMSERLMMGLRLNLPETSDSRFDCSLFSRWDYTCKDLLVLKCTALRNVHVTPPGLRGLTPLNNRRPRPRPGQRRAGLLEADCARRRP